MAKTIDIPYELREFNIIFEKLTYGVDDTKIFDDFLTICMGYFGGGTMDEEREYIWKPYSDKQKGLFQDLFNCYIHTIHKIFNGEFKDIKFYTCSAKGPEWYDFFGCYYELLASRGKKSALGQFFTPPHLCDLLQMMNGPQGDKKTGLKVNDPACGSGRTLLSFNSAYPGNYLLGQDLDMICCKMTAINMMMHGAIGEVINGDALAPNDFRNGWLINPSINILSLPHIIKMKSKEESTVWTMLEAHKNNISVEQNVPRETKNVPRLENNQLTLF